MSRTQAHLAVIMGLFYGDDDILYASDCSFPTS